MGYQGQGVDSASARREYPVAAHGDGVHLCGSTALILFLISTLSPCAPQNPVLDKVITFGGYAPTAPSHFEAKTVYVFSFYADTFMYGVDAPGRGAVWKQVLTHGFPTYRAQAKLVADPATGRTFLFGGYVNSQYIPSQSKEESRSFGDLWELRVDVPGGHFADADVEDEARTARVGPWQRCFSCGSAGPWKKCGGEASFFELSFLFSLMVAVRYL